MREKLNELKKRMDEQKMDAAWITSQPNVKYVSGFTGEDSTVLITRKEIYFLTDSRYTEHAEKELGAEFEVKEVGTGDLLKTVSELISNCKTLGIEKDAVSFSSFEKYRACFPVEFLSVDADLSEMREIKDEDEIRIMHDGARLTEEILLALYGKMKAGMTEIDVAAELLYLYSKSGVKPSFDPIIASGVNGSMPHAIPTSKKLMQGDMVTIDCGCVYRGYCTDITRTIAVSGVEERQEKIYNMVKYTQRECLKYIREGAKACEIDALARSMIDNGGYRGCFGHGLGHGVGIEIHENPRLNMTSETVLKSGMVVTVEPGIYVKGIAGVRIEDMLVVRGDGFENFYTISKELIII